MDTNTHTTKYTNRKGRQTEARRDTRIKADFSSHVGTELQMSQHWNGILQMYASSQMYKQKTMSQVKAIKADTYTGQIYTLSKNGKFFTPKGRAKK